MSSRRRRGAIIGFGFIAERGHLPAYAHCEELEIVAIADVCAQRRAAAAAALPGVRVYDDHASLLRAEHTRLDFVDITAPPYAHASIAANALECGLHVLCEKPLATRADDVRELCGRAERHRRVLYPSHNYHHAPVIAAVREALASGAIGRVHMVTLSTFRNTHARGVREWHEHWRRERRYSGGGIAMDHGSHTFYLAFEWLRCYPTSVVAKSSALGSFDTEDNISVALTFPTGLATAHLTWTAGFRKVIYTLHGEHGAMRVEDDDIEITRSPAALPGPWDRRTLSAPSRWADAGHAQWFEPLLCDFARAMDARDYVGRHAVDALHCIEVIDAAYASARDECRERALPAAVHAGAA